MSTLSKVILTAIISIAVAGGGAYYFMDQKLVAEKKDKDTKISELQTQVNNLSGTSSTTSTTDTSNWKTYTNASYGFSFKYPSDWTLVEGDEITNSGGVKGRSFTLTNSDTIQKPTILIYLNPVALGMESSNFDYKFTNNAGIIQMIPFGNIPTEVLKSQSNTPPNGPVRKSSEGEEGSGSLTVGKNLFVIDTNFSVGSTNYRKAIYEILSTFQFTN